MAQLAALTIAAIDPPALAAFWAGILRWPVPDGAGDEVVVTPNDDTGFDLRFRPSDAPKTEPNRMHFDLTSNSLLDQQETVARALALGGRHLDIGQLPEEEHVVLADPEGNEFCVIEPGNNFLAECGFVGALACDGTPALGYFWSAALGWPLVWDQDQETAIRSLHGGPKITWGGPPIAPKSGANRLHFDVTPTPPAEQADEVERLISLGATVAFGQSNGEWVDLLDPDGNEFRVLAG